MSKNVLLLGATGTAGSAITEKLLSDTDYHITLFARHAGGIINGPQVLFQSLRAFRRSHGIDKGEQGLFLLVV